MIENIELAELDNTQDKNTDDTKGNIFNTNNLALCGHLKTSAEVVLAEINISLEDLFALKKGSIIPTEQSIDSPLTLILNGKPIASGRLVVSGEHFGFEVTDIKVG